jgi:hypothetical protein
MADEEETSGDVGDQDLLERDEDLHSTLGSLSLRYHTRLIEDDRYQLKTQLAPLRVPYHVRNQTSP